MTDQYTFRNPVTAYEQISPPEQHQPPGQDHEQRHRAAMQNMEYE